MADLFPAFCCMQKDGQLFWRSLVQPTQASLQYLVEISLGDGGYPTARVLAPPVGDSPVHAQRDHLHVCADGNLCLYHPRDRVWTRGASVADLIVPRLLHWLRLYEFWLPTGKWFAKQAPPGGKPAWRGGPAS